MLFRSEATSSDANQKESYTKDDRSYPALFFGSMSGEPRRNPMLVTIAIPFLNGSLTIRAAIQSVFAQTHDKWELLLMDDGSTDDSLQIAKSVRDPRVRVTSDGVRRGLVARLNQAAELADSPLLARMDADDLMHPERLARQVEYLRAHEHVDLVGTGLCTIGPDDRPVGMRSVAASQLRLKGLQHGYLHATVTGRTGWFRANPLPSTLAG